MRQGEAALVHHDRECEALVGDAVGVLNAPGGGVRKYGAQQGCPLLPVMPRRGPSQASGARRRCGAGGGPLPQSSGRRSEKAGGSSCGAGRAAARCRGNHAEESAATRIGPRAPRPRERGAQSQTHLHIFAKMSLFFFCIAV